MRTAFVVLTGLGLVALAGALPGCSEGIAIGEWREAGTSQPPLIDGKKDLRLTTLSPGTGALVKERVLLMLWVVTHRTCTKYPGPVSFTGESDVDILWLWTGREPGLSVDSECRAKGCSDADLWAEENRWGRLGDKSLRAALIGKAVGEKFELQQGPAAEGYVAVPLYGFQVLFDNATLNAGGYPWFPESRIAYHNKFDQTQNISAQIEILAACPGRLLRRQAKMNEFTLRWSALEGKCPAPDEEVRLQIGPLHFDRNVPFQGANSQWRYRYRQVHPPEKFPQEYGIRRPGPPRYEHLCHPMS